MNLGHKRSEATPVKQEWLGKILDFQFRLAQKVREKNGIQKPFLYYDLNAGSGVDPRTGEDGSPIIALRLLNKHFPHSFVAHFYEYKPQEYEALSRRIEVSPNVHLHHQDNRTVSIVDMRSWNDWSGWQLGLIYCDPNTIDVPYEKLAEFNHLAPRMDILINVTATSLKRTEHIKGLTLEGMLNHINKKHWWIRTPYSKWQWTMFLGMNTDVFKTRNLRIEGKQLELVPLESEAGQAHFTRATLTVPELKDLIQPKLFEMEDK